MKARLFSLFLRDCSLWPPSKAVAMVEACFIAQLHASIFLMATEYHGTPCYTRETLVRIHAW